MTRPSGAGYQALIWMAGASQSLRKVDTRIRAWLANVLARIADHPVLRLYELLPWHWSPQRGGRSLAA